MSAKFKAPKGTFDVLPEQSEARNAIKGTAARILSRAGYGRIDTPIFEDSELFARGVGESTDIVQKEMFSFEDKGGRSITLRPEGTAPVCRAYVEHGMHKLPQPVKLWYGGPFFRYEAPQAGRTRQFHQLGLETIGTDSPLADAEAIMLLDEILRTLGVPELRLRLSSLGSPESRAAYLDDLRAHLRASEGELSKEVRGRIDSNPLRAFDADDDGTKAVMAEAPVLLNRLEGDDADHFEQVRGLLDDAGVAYEIDPTLVRGLDYYTRTVFEFESSALGAQSGVGGGGRYDGLVEELGGPPTAGVGWGAGVERIAIAIDAKAELEPRDVFVASEEGSRRQAFGIVNELRKAGVSAETDMAERSVKGQMKQADRVGARFTVILEDGATPRLRDMGSGEQRDVAADKLLEEIKAAS